MAYECGVRARRVIKVGYAQVKMCRRAGREFKNA